jgi:hypothetical protein
MGQEVSCRAVIDGRASEGKLYLETDALIFRAAQRTTIPLVSVRRAEASDGLLKVVWGDQGRAEFELGAVAERWAIRIANPPTLADKLGLKAGTRVAVRGLSDADYSASLGTVNVEHCHDVANADLVLLGAECPAGLEAVGPIAAAMGPGTALWIVYPKGRLDITEVGVIEAGRSAGLVDVKVARYSATHTALKFVAPRRK